MRFNCPPCQELWDGWTNYTAPYRKWIQYERTGVRSLESYHQKAQERRELVRRQCDGIIQSCRRKGCMKPRAREVVA